MNSSTAFQTATIALVDETVGDNEADGVSWLSLGVGLVLAIAGISGLLSLLLSDQNTRFGLESYMILPYLKDR